MWLNTSYAKRQYWQRRCWMASSGAPTRPRLLALETFKKNTDHIIVTFLFSGWLAASDLLLGAFGARHGVTDALPSAGQLCQV